MGPKAAEAGAGMVKYNEVSDWTQIQAGTPVENSSTPPHGVDSIFADTTYVVPTPSVLKVTLLAYENRNVTQNLVLTNNNPPYFESVGTLKAKVFLVERGILNIANSGALDMAGAIIRSMLKTNPDETRAMLASYGLTTLDE